MKTGRLIFSLVMVLIMALAISSCGSSTKACEAKAAREKEKTAQLEQDKKTFEQENRADLK